MTACNCSKARLCMSLFSSNNEQKYVFKNIYPPPTGERNRVSSALGLCYLTKCPNSLTIPQCLQFNYFGSIGPSSISQHSLINGSASNCTAVILTSPWHKPWTVHLFQKGGGSRILHVTHFSSKAMWRIKTEVKFPFSNSQFPSAQAPDAQCDSFLVPPTDLQFSGPCLASDDCPLQSAVERSVLLLKVVPLPPVHCLFPPCVKLWTSLSHCSLLQPFSP